MTQLFVHFYAFFIFNYWKQSYSCYNSELTCPLHFGCTVVQVTGLEPRYSCFSDLTCPTRLFQLHPVQVAAPTPTLHVQDLSQLGGSLILIPAMDASGGTSFYPIINQ